MLIRVEHFHDYGLRVLESIVRKPMVLDIDNNGAVEYANNWSTGGRMRLATIRLAFVEN
jgi:hypothetical protein